jgi:hypothetical protein
MALDVNIQNDWLDYVAAFGAAGAAVAAAWAAWVANRQNQRLLRRALHLGRSPIEVTGPASAQLTLRVTNEGLRPITVQNVGFRITGVSGAEIVAEASGAKGPDLPLPLQDGEAEEWVFDASLLVGAMHQNRALMQMFAVDSRGTVYVEWVTREPLRRIARTVKLWWARRRENRKWRKLRKELRQQRQGK